MQLSKMKNIIVLRGMASNVVDEAIVVLKPNVKLKQSEYNSKNKHISENKSKKMILLKEAETTIETYVNKLQKESTKIQDNKFKIKYRFLQICNIILILSMIIATLIIY